MCGGRHMTCRESASVQERRVYGLYNNGHISKDALSFRLSMIKKLHK